MSRRTKALLVAGAAWFIGITVVTSIVVPSNWTERNVPPQLRADRWELTPDGRIARSRTEEVCGELPLEAWVDMPPGAPQPVLLGGTDELTACFDDKVAPVFSIDGP